MAKIDAKKLTQIERVTVPLEVLEKVNKLREMPEWSALKIVMQLYIDNRMRVAYNLDEKNPSFPILHAKESAQALAFKYLIHFVDKELKRLSQEEKDGS
jgi:hypothetical protein